MNCNLRKVDSPLTFLDCTCTNGSTDWQVPCSRPLHKAPLELPWLSRMFFSIRMEQFLKRRVQVQKEVDVQNEN